MDTKNLNEWQKAAARAYCGGEYAHIADGEPWEGGDSLFEYLMADLADADSAEVAAQRLEQAIADLDGLLAALSDPPHPPHTKDSDCTLDDTNTCVVCGVDHSEDCPDCRGRGFHRDGCASAQLPESPESIATDGSIAVASTKEGA